MKESTIIFLHIPKAAGTTLVKIIEKQYGKGSVSRLYDDQSTDRFKRLSGKEQRQIKALVGHFPFGIHEWLSQPYAYMTMLREPVDRVISNYYYVLRTPNHRVYEQAKDMSLKEYMESGINTFIDNGQVRFLSNSCGVPFGECHEGMLEEAKRTLAEDIEVVGLSERFDDSLTLLSQKFGWSVARPEKANVTSDRPSIKEISDNALEAIRKYNLLDIELYRFAKGLFEKQLKECRGRKPE